MSVLALVLAFQFVPSPLQPATYASPDGRWTLAVDPVERYGAGAAHYRCEHDGRVAWDGRLPFALHVARVTDDGIAVGCASTEGRDVGAGDILVVRVTPEGGARVCATTSAHSSRYPHGAPWPRVADVRVKADARHFSVALDDLEEHRPTMWWFDLPSGAPVTSRPFVAAPWGDHEWLSEPVAHAELVALTRIDLRASTSVVGLPIGVLELNVALPRWDAAVAIDEQGSIAVLDTRTGSIALHDALGKLVACPSVPSEWTRMTGRLYARHDGWSVQGSGIATVSRAGDTVEGHRQPRPIWRTRVLPIERGPFAGWSWRGQREKLELLDPVGVVRRVVERMSDRRWTDDLRDVAIADDGSAVALEVRRSETPSALLLAVAPDEELVRTFALDGVSLAAFEQRLAVVGTTAIVVEDDANVLVIDVCTGEARRIVLDGVRSPVAAVIPSAGGRELLRFGGGSSRVVRYAMPSFHRPTGR